MDYVNLQEELDRLERDGEQAKLQWLLELMVVFPDLNLFRDHYGQVKACSAEANPEVDCIEMDTCHDCDGRPIRVWPYIVMDRGTRLYSDPPMFVVADQNVLGFGEVPRDGWDEALQAVGLDSSVIQMVRDHLSRHAPVSYLED